MELSLRALAIKFVNQLFGDVVIGLFNADDEDGWAIGLGFIMLKERRPFRPQLRNKFEIHTPV